MLEQAIYDTVEEVLSENYLNLLTLGNSVQQAVSQNENYQMHEGESIGDSFNAFYDLLLKLDYYSKDEKADLTAHINGQMHHFFASQNEITQADFIKTIKINVEFISIYWNDLKMFKGMKNIGDIAKNRALAKHNEVIGNLLNEKTVTALANVGFEKEHIILYSLSKEDRTVMSVAALYLPTEVKEEMIQFYKDKNFIEQRVPNYEQFMLDNIRADIAKRKS